MDQNRVLDEDVDLTPREVVSDNPGVAPTAEQQGIPESDVIGRDHTGITADDDPNDEAQGLEDAV